MDKLVFLVPAWVSVSMFLCDCTIKDTRAAKAPDLGALEGKAWTGTASAMEGVDPEAGAWLDSLARNLSAENVPGLAFAYPRDRTIFPPDFAAPSFRWSDSTGAGAFWVIRIDRDSAPSMYALTSSPRLSPPRIDSAAIPTGTPMEIPDLNRYRHWKPSPQLWEAMKSASAERWTTLTVFSLRADQPTVPVAAGRLSFKTSADSVKAPIFYRDVPIMPTKNGTGRIQPLSRHAQRLIRWSLRDVSRPEGKTIIASLPTCANCHSFSSDGKTVGLDLDGPQSDKGTYGVAKVGRITEIGRKDVYSWNEDFKGKPKGGKTIGFLSRLSPDGKYVVTTVNEAVYIHNYMNNRYIQVFYPTRGVLAVYSKATGEIRLLPGADDTAYVHCDPVWTPDGRQIVFARARAKDPYVPGQKDPEFPNDPNETQIRYGLYRIPFNGGRGGKAEAIAGASDNGMSNTFPKVSPDGRFVVFVKCRNGQLLRPDGRLWMVPLQGGAAHLMDCNLDEMNSWHSFSPGGRWMVFSSKGMSYYTQMFLTHIAEDGSDSPPVLIENATAANRAVNLPEFANLDYDSLDRIDVPAIQHMQYLQDASDLAEAGHPAEARKKMEQALEAEKEDMKFRSEVQVLLAWMQESQEGKMAGMRAALRTDPSNPLARFNLGVMLEKAGRLKEAIENYRKSADLDPENAWALASLAAIRMRSDDSALRDIPKAIELASRANVIAKYREPSILKTLARAYSEAGRYREAERAAGMGLDLARQQGLENEVKELENELPVYRHDRSFSWALRQMAGNKP